MNSLNSNPASKGKLISPEEVAQSLAILCESTLGVHALHIVNDLIDAGGSQLPPDQQKAVLSLLVASWTGSYSPTPIHA